MSGPEFDRDPEVVQQAARIIEIGLRDRDVDPSESFEASATRLVAPPLRLVAVMIAFVFDGDLQSHDRQVHACDEAAFSVAHFHVASERSESAGDEKHPQLGLLGRLRGGIEKLQRSAEHGAAPPCGNTLDSAADGLGADDASGRVSDGDEFGEREVLGEIAERACRRGDGKA
ncbi:hypothetical protein [Microbacterium gilvum]|uniref:hypothetical protein n=1 Tax=Microbacterium gilvum TaxID=1336204 RepID=UPI0031E6B4BB